MDKEKVIRDGKMINGIMSHYTGDTGAHFGFIVTEDGLRNFMFGGRLDLMMAGLAEALVTYLVKNPEIKPGFIDVVRNTAYEVLGAMEEQVAEGRGPSEEE